RLRDADLLPPLAAILAKRTPANSREIGWFRVLAGAGLYLVLLLLQESLFGVASMSWVSGLFG
ncbi:MAG: hypothetical protein VW169_12480, partial [Rhodospirillaceae bacterium]